MLLRQDNADRRLTQLGCNIGLSAEKAKQRLTKKEELIARLSKFVSESSVSLEQVNEYLISQKEMPIIQREQMEKLVKRSNVKLVDLLSVAHLESGLHLRELGRLGKEVIEQVEIDLKYDGYIYRQQIEIEKFEKSENVVVPESFDYSRVRSLSSEGREKLSKIKPQSLGQASRISGVTPSDISVLMVYLHR